MLPLLFECARARVPQSARRQRTSIFSVSHLCKVILNLFPFGAYNIGFLIHCILSVFLFKVLTFLLRIDLLKADYLYFETFSLIQPKKLFQRTHTKLCVHFFLNPFFFVIATYT